MARTLSEIYQEARNIRNQRLELTEINNSSKMSVMDAFTWVTSACVWSFENLLDVFKVDVAMDLQDKINGTPAYYANALLKYQHGDRLEMNEEGTQFYYPTIDETKRVVTKVAYSEVSHEHFYDKDLVLKVATGDEGAYQQIDSDTMTAIRAYMQQISFAGTHMTIVSRKGDILIPKLTVFYDGGVTAGEIYQAIEVSLNDFIAHLSFDGAVYVQKIIDVIQRVEHVTDVYVDEDNLATHGIFVVQFDDNNNFISDESGGIEQRVQRYFIPHSGFLRQSTGRGDEADIPTWRQTITLVIEKPNTGFITEP